MPKHIVTPNAANEYLAEFRAQSLARREQEAAAQRAQLEAEAAQQRQRRGAAMSAVYAALPEPLQATLRQSPGNDQPHGTWESYYFHLDLGDGQPWLTVEATPTGHDWRLTYQTRPPDWDWVNADGDPDERKQVHPGNHYTNHYDFTCALEVALDHLAAAQELQARCDAEYAEQVALAAAAQRRQAATGPEPAEHSARQATPTVQWRSWLHDADVEAEDNHYPNATYIALRVIAEALISLAEQR